MPTSVRNLIDPDGPEYAQGLAAYRNGDCYTSCPHKAPRKALCPKRTNWFEGYWTARTEATSKPNLSRPAPPTPIQLRVVGYTDRDGKIRTGYR